VAGSLAENPQVAPLLLPGPDGQSAYELACPADGSKLLIRHISWAGEGDRLRQTERTIKIPSPLQGTPAVVDGMLVLPLAGGHLVRLPLPLPADATTLDSGPDWRSRVAPPGVQGHVLALGGDLFLTTDGGRGLTSWRWPRGETFLPLGTTRERPTTLDLSDRVAAAPVLLPVQAGTAPRVCVIDSAGVLTLLSVRDGGLLEVKRTWDLHGTVTAGPFVRTLPNGAVRVGCVMDGVRLMWLDPNQNKPAQEYRTQGGSVVGQPQLIDGLLVVADQSGRIVALDPVECKPMDAGYQLAGSVVPAASPVSFGVRRLFVSLSDGTALLLELDKLLAPKE
jgi:hypothetical protein